MYEENNSYYNYNNSTANDYGTAPNTNATEPKAVKPKKKHPFLRKAGTMVGSGVAFGLAAALVFIGVVKATGLDESLQAGANAKAATQEESTSASTDKASTTTDGTGEIATTKIAQTTKTQADGTYTVSQIAQGCMSSIVSITNQGVEEVRTMFGTQAYDATSVGSGIIIGQNDTELLIATNNHVVSGSEELSVCFGDDENKVVSAKIKGMDSDNDLAIVSVNMDDLNEDIKASISIAKLGDSDALNVGDQVVAIGNALGYGQSVTTGIVSAMNREVTIDGETAKLIQTDAAINPGNSGGALLNMQGELIGINSSKFASTTVEGMGYAIPIDTALPILQELMTRETRDTVAAEEQGALGISCQSVSKDIAQMYNIPEGVYVVATPNGSAAANAGLQKGDIITKFDGMSISSVDELKSTLQYYKEGESVELTIQRANDNNGYEEKTVTITLEKAKAETSSESTQSSENNNSSNQYSNPFGDLFEEFQGNQGGNSGMSW